MATTTSNFGLRKPTVNDNVNVALDIAANMDLLDAHAHSGTYGLISQARPGNRMATLGDSITAGSYSNATQQQGVCWPVYASIMSQQRLHLVRNAGIGGEASANMLARFTTDVTPYAPNLVTILAGTNDIGTGVAFATFKANIRALVLACRQIGAVPVLATIPPRDAGGFGATIVAWNTWVRRYAEGEGLAVLDFYRTLTDPVNGSYLAAYVSDGVHPNAAGSHALGEVAAAALESMVPNNSPFLAVNNADTNNMLTNGLFINGATQATGWTLGSGTTGITFSLVADTVIPGKMQQIVGSGSTQLVLGQYTIATGWSVGDTLRACGVVTSDGTVVDMQVQCTGGSLTPKPIAAISGVLTRATYCQDFVVPAGTTSLNYLFVVGSGTWSGTVKWGQAGLYNLTTMGALT